MKSAKWENIFKGWNRKESNEILTLKQVPVFKDFQYSDFRELENLMHKREYKAGDYILRIEHQEKECISLLKVVLKLR